MRINIAAGFISINTLSAEQLAETPLPDAVQKIVCHALGKRSVGTPPRGTRTAAVLGLGLFCERHSGRERTGVLAAVAVAGLAVGRLDGDDAPCGLVEHSGDRV